MTTANENSPGKPEGVITSPPATGSASSLALGIAAIIIGLVGLVIVATNTNSSTAIGIFLMLWALNLDDRIKRK